MKSGQLVKRLQELDPDGEIEVCIGNEDIHFLSREPAYYDGALQVYQRDMSQDGFFNIRGVRRTYKGEKIQVHSYSVSDLLNNQPDLQITYEGMSGESEQRYRQQDELLRREARSAQ